MDQATLISTFKKHTSGLGETLTDDEILVHLNRTRFDVLPNEVDGLFSETIWVMSPAFGGSDNSARIPESVIRLNDDAKWALTFGSRTITDLTVWRDYSRFTSRYPDRNTVGTPTALCIYGSFVYFDMSFGYTTADLGSLTMTARGKAPKISSGNVLTEVITQRIPTTGIFDNTLSMAVVAGAAWDYLIEVEDVDGVQREAALYDKYVSLMRTGSMNSLQRRRPARSF